MLAAEDLPDVGDRLMWGVHEKTVVVTPNSLVEGGKLGGVQSSVLLVAYLIRNMLSDGTQQRIEYFGRGLVWLVEISIELLRIDWTGVLV